MFWFQEGLRVNLMNICVCTQEKLYDLQFHSIACISFSIFLLCETEKVSFTSPKYYAKYAEMILSYFNTETWDLTESAMKSMKKF